MKIEKREKYVQNLYAALHTCSGKATYTNLDRNEIVKKDYKKHYRNGNDVYYLELNPNKAAIPGAMIKSYSEWNRVLQDALERVEAQEFQLTRADLSFNSDDPADYELFKKLNRLLICCISQAYGIQNCYQSQNLWTFKSLSVAIKSDSIEAENYDKEAESHGLTETKNRLELRSKRITDSLQDEFLQKWFKRLDEAVQQFQAVQDRYNQELLRIWWEDQQKPKREQDYISLTAFLMVYRECIFTRKQLENLLEKIGVKNPVNTAKKFKEYHSIEFYSLKDLQIIIKAIKDATKEYFNR